MGNIFSQVIKYLLIVIFIDFIISQKIRHCFVYYKDDLLQETAINISYACGHLQPDLTVLDLTGLTRQEEDHSGVQYSSYSWHFMGSPSCKARITVSMYCDRGGGVI